MKFLVEVFFIPFLSIKILWLHLLEERKIRMLFYKNKLFKQADLALKKAYRFKNPYRISKNFERKRKNSLIHTYGETPLTTLFHLLKLCKITKEDCFVDLGCGRGRIVLFVASIFRCKSVGVDWILTFCHKAQKIATSLSLTSQFFSQNILSYTLQEATIIYFYSLCMEELPFLKMIAHLDRIKKGTKVITVSYPLSDYSTLFFVIHTEVVFYPWGKTTAYINEKI